MKFDARLSSLFHKINDYKHHSGFNTQKMKNELPRLMFHVGQHSKTYLEVDC